MSGSTENDQRVMSLVEMALRQPPQERASYLRRACQNDQELYQETCTAVRWEERLGSFLLHPMIAFETFPRPFEPKQIISQRFEIIREIGEGGMGVVYEAFDQKRNVRIAIKAAKPGYQRLLSPELEGALSVRHQNVCRVNEIHTAQTDHGEIDFLSMELLDGETLTAHLKTHGSMFHLQALNIALQLCAGLAEAHRSGVIHKDLKSANVILCPTPNGGFRAVITDFGLAGRMQPGEIAGTPAYMAPEIFHGKEASQASDIYALGIILYEMIAGSRPFQDESIQERTEKRPLPPSTFTPGLPSRWDRVIMWCLDPSPEARPSDPTQIVLALEKPRPRRALALAVPLLVLASLFLPQVRQRIWPPPNVRLAVLSAGAPGNSPAITDGVLQDVAERVRHIRSGRRTVSVITPSEARNQQVQTLEQAQQILHATHALQISIRRDGDDTISAGAIIDLETKAHLRDFSARYSPAVVGKLPEAIASEASLGLRLQSPAAPEVLSPAATTPYDRALFILRGDGSGYDEAITLFEEAARQDPRSPLPLAGLIEADIQQYDATKKPSYLADAHRALHEAENLNADTARVRLASGLLNETVGRYGKALDDYSRVEDLEPRNVDALLHMARVYNKLDMPDKAIASFRKAANLDAAYYKPYHEMGVFYYFRGRYSEAADQFQKSVERAPRFEEYTNLGAALDELGRENEAEAALLKSLSIRETGRALNSMGAMRAYQRRDEDAVFYYKRAITMDASEFVYVENLADSLRRLRRQRDANIQYQKALQMALADLRQNPRLGYSRAFVAYIAAQLGDEKRAEEEIGQALQLSPDDNKVIRNAVLTYEALGRRDQAIQVLGGATPELLHELDRQPDLAGFRQDPRFKQLVARNSDGGT